jgi:hypothetical protein
MRVSYRSAFLLSGGKIIEADAPAHGACPESTLYEENELRTWSTEQWLRKRHCGNAMSHSHDSGILSINLVRNIVLLDAR